MFLSSSGASRLDVRTILMMAPRRPSSPRSLHRPGIPEAIEADSIAVFKKLVHASRTWYQR